VEAHDVAITGPGRPGPMALSDHGRGADAGGMVNRVVHFEIPVDDPGRAGEFYRSVFGWGVERWGPMEYWNLTTGETGGPGAEGALKPRAEGPEGVTVYVGVDDIDAALVGVEAAGGARVTDKMPIPTMGWSAHVRDSEGNLIGLFQPDPAVGG
jgi:uncharacterized protein